MIGVMFICVVVAIICAAVCHYRHWLGQISHASSGKKTTRMKWGDFERLLSASPKRIYFEETNNYKDTRKLDRLPIVIYNTYENLDIWYEAEYVIKIKFSFFDFYRYIVWLERKNAKDKKNEEEENLQLILKTANKES